MNPEQRLQVLDGGALDSRDLVDSVRDGDVVIGEADLPSVGLLRFEASGVRRDRTGVHAMVRVMVGDAVASYGYMNTDKDAERVRLSNSSFDRIGGEKPRKEAIKLRLDQFCLKLWETWTRSDEAWWLTPVPDGNPPGWVLEPYIVEGGGTILFGPPGTCKSWTGLMWSACVATGGGPWTANAARTVLFVNLERSQASLGWRMGRIQKALGVQPRVLELSARGRTLADVREPIERSVKKHGVDLVVVDSLSRAGAGNLNDNEAMNSAMDVLNGFKTSWCVLAHSPRADATHVFGSVMADAAADLVVRLSSAPHPDDASLIGIQLEVPKANDVPKARAAVWAYQFDHRGLAQVRRAEAGEFPDLSAGMGSQADQIYDCLKGGSATVTEVADELDLAPNQVRAILNRSPRFVCVEAGGGRGKASRWGIKSLVSEEA